MTGNGHKITGVIAATITTPMALDLGLTGWLMGVFTILGSTAPDYLEIRKPSGGTMIRHRTITHWLPLWVLLFAYGCVSIGAINSPIPIPLPNTLFAEAIVGFAIGGLLHLLFDIPNPMGIPILTPYRRVSLNLWRSGKAEWLIFLMMGGLSAFYWDIPGLIQPVLK